MFIPWRSKVYKSEHTEALVSLVGTIRSAPDEQAVEALRLAFYEGAFRAFDRVARVLGVEADYNRTLDEITAKAVIALREDFASQEREHGSLDRYLSGVKL